MDADLLRGFRKGDREALTRVYRLHIDDVENLVRRALVRLGLLTAANLADVVQEGFLRAFSERARLGYDGLREYRPYLLTVARNVVMDWARRHGREIPTADLPDDGPPDAAEPGIADEAVGFPQPVVALAAAYVQGLSPELGAVHHRRFVLTEPQRQAADALGISRQTLRTRERKLVTGLRRALRRAGLGTGEQGPAAAAGEGDVRFFNPNAASPGSTGRGET